MGGGAGSLGGQEPDTLGQQVGSRLLLSCPLIKESPTCSEASQKRGRA
jgi:hypothetical protein